MKLKDIITNDYFRLFFTREGKVVLGKRRANLWLLSVVLFVTFLAIAFSNASLGYLDIKMNDPFINWVDIKYDAGSDGDYWLLKESLKDETLMETYHFTGYQTDKYKYMNFATANHDSRPLDCRFFADIQTLLVQAILDKDNVIGGHSIALDKLINTSYGIIITQNALVNKLGYENEIPAFVNIRAFCDSEAEEEFGVVIDGNYSEVPIPVLAVVKQLPNSMDAIGTKHFYECDRAKVFNMYNSVYFSSFIYYLPNNVNSSEFVSFIEETTVEQTDLTFETDDDYSMPELASHANGKFVSLFYDYEDDVDFDVNYAIHSAVMEKYGNKGVFRVYQYFPDGDLLDNDSDDFISVHFEDLDKVVEFQQFAKEECNIDIEMSQINAKENFNEVSIMANILSWTMIVFAIVCIILFIVNLLQSYFQKVKRNLGTFKAFGMGNKQLISIYVLIMVVIICIAIVIAIVSTLFIQYMLPLLGILKDGIYNYIDLWSGKTLGAVVIIIAASITTVYVVMSTQLKATPGDLIYDR